MGQKNFSSYLQFLVKEINEKTSYDLTLQPWRQLQLYGLQKGKLLDEPKVREMLAKLVGP